MKKNETPNLNRQIDFLWGSKERPSRGPRPGLSLERIIAAAVEIADADGIGAVSMQRVATELGFATMALYRYVPGKTELIGAMIDSALGEPPAFKDRPDEWRPQLESWGRQMAAVFRAHPWALEVSGPGRVMGPNELGWLEAAVAVLAGTGLSGSEQTDAVLAVSGQVKSWAQYSIPQGEDESPELQWSRAFGELISRHADRYPALMAAISAEAVAGPEGVGGEFALRCVLDGIEVRIVESVARAHAEF